MSYSAAFKGLVSSFLAVHFRLYRKGASDRMRNYGVLRSPSTPARAMSESQVNREGRV